MSNATLILAAGSSSRLQQPKQLLKWKNQSLIRHTIAQHSKYSSSIFVVTGGYRTDVFQEIKDQNCIEIFNTQWEEGLGSSIRKGVEYITQNHKEITKIMISLCDTPLILSKHIATLWRQSNDFPIVISKFRNTKGVPAVFDQKYFEQLLTLKGDQGAKKIIGTYKSDVFEVISDQLFFDIDTIEDYRLLLEQQVIN